MTPDPTRSDSAPEWFVCERDGRWYVNDPSLDLVVEVGPTDEQLYKMLDAVSGFEAKTPEGQRELVLKMRAALR